MHEVNKHILFSNPVS